tara:strand:+ start:8749 stop:9408 length:660 start_codon:yes stop_codon:yes gene_type:complete
VLRGVGLTKSYTVKGRPKVVLDALDFELPTGVSLGLLGRNGAGKSTLLSILSGAIRPDAGEVVSDGTVSWPVGLRAAFHKDMTGVQNVRFVARVYGVESDELVEYVRHFSELGDHFYMPFKTYSSGMRSRISFGTALGLHFDTYLVDEVTAVGDAAFKRKSRAVLRDRLARSSAIMVSHNMAELREICDAGLVLADGKGLWFDDIDAAIDHHEGLMARR